MRCIFCKGDSSNSVSAEHIVPESLGNKEHVLPPGLVCDECNNYIARKIEKPFLDSPYGKGLRHDMKIENKRGIIPPVPGIHVESLTKILSLGDGSFSFDNDADVKRFLDSKGSTGTFVFLVTPDLPTLDYSLSRFIAKVGVEILAMRCLASNELISEMIDHPALGQIRQYVRRGIPGLVWPVHIRRIYPSGHIFPPDQVSEQFQVLHEWTILQTETSEYYAVVAICGVEYSINLGGPELEGYKNWLMVNGNKSPLYMS